MTPRIDTASLLLILSLLSLINAIPDSITIGSVTLVFTVFLGIVIGVGVFILGVIFVCCRHCRQVKRRKAEKANMAKTTSNVELGNPPEAAVADTDTDQVLKKARRAPDAADNPGKSGNGTLVRLSKYDVALKLHLNGVNDKSKYELDENTPLSAIKSALVDDEEDLPLAEVARKFSNEGPKKNVDIDDDDVKLSDVLKKVSKRKSLVRSAKKEKNADDTDDELPLDVLQQSVKSPLKSMEPKWVFKKENKAEILTRVNS